MGKQKLFNDPIYGLINFKSAFVYDLINHRYFQRLRRIYQMGMTHLTYPGATHSRFQHAIGALYLMQSAANILREKSIDISEEEFEGMCAAILLHDIGHGPISHSLEGMIVNVPHEEISLLLMEQLNEEFNGKLTLAIKVFKNTYHRPFMHQLVSGQLDLDRMDYITRDSYYSGVAEGTIGYNRIIKMFNVVDEQLVLEEKALYSIQKFLIAREIMYKQVYLHKTSIAAEVMLKKYFRYVKLNFRQVKKLTPGLLISKSFNYFLEKSRDKLDSEGLNNFVKLDDHDIYQMLKSSLDSNDFVVQQLSNRILNRNLFKISISGEVFASDFTSRIRQKVKDTLNLDDDICDYFVIEGKESVQTYSPKSEAIMFLKKDGTIQELSQFLPDFLFLTLIDRHFLCYTT